MESKIDALNEFITTFDAEPDWLKLMDEESTELLEAIENVLKEASDLVYVTLGAIASGQIKDDSPDNILNENTDTALKWIESLCSIIPSETRDEAFRRVHASNMSKLGPDGKPLRREDGKVLKGPNYMPPVLKDLVRLP